MQEFRKLENLPICKEKESYWIAVSVVSNSKDQTDYQCIIDMQTEQWEKCVEQKFYWENVGNMH